MSLNMMANEGPGWDTTRFWDRNARKYAATPIKDEAGYERTIARTIELIRGFNCVHELGCGTGTTALRLAPYVNRIVATDISPEMITIARAKAAAAGVTNVAFYTTSAGAAPRTDIPCDSILAFNLLHLVQPRAQLLDQVIRRLRPGGLFISKTPCLSEMNALIRLAVPPMRLIGLAPPVSFFRSIDLEREIGQAGFAIEERARHGSGGKDARVFIVAQKPARNWSGV